MKRLIFGFLAVSAMLCGCQKNDVREHVQDCEVLQATIEEVASTRTVMDADNNIRWSEGDQVIAFMKSSYGHKYQLISSFAGKTYADFSIVSSGGGNLSAGTEWDHNVVYYPYSDAVEAEKSGDNYVLDVVLPSEQTYAEDSFGNGAMAMVAVSEDNNITFRNVLGGMKLQLKGTQTVTSITLQGKNSEKLSGAATVTAYTDETKPAITMVSGASTSVTLNCGSGVQLSEGTATEFIIALPPVLFSEGFTVTVTDSDSKTYTVETDKANTVLRSSLLVMPTVVLKEDVVEEEENPDPDGTLVEAIALNKTSLTLAPGTSYTLTGRVVPTDATDKTLTWSSDGTAIATVDQNGVVTAVSDGFAVITAVAIGGVSESCTVTVITPPASQATVDYVDEYGVNHGKGVAIGATVWAPVNCGYKAASDADKGYPYGKLYQWGRKYGQGYSTSYDADEPTIEEGPVSLKYGQAEDNSNVFFTSTSDFNHDWLSTQDDKLWNSGTESAPVKTEYDPCPEGWRVPTYAELVILRNTKSSWTTNDGQKGYWFSGASEAQYDVPVDEDAKVFFPAAGGRNNNGGFDYYRGYYGNYWSSRPYNGYADLLYFYSDYAIMFNDRRADGYSVRCVQE